MRFSEYSKGAVIEASIEDPKVFSIENITRYIQLDEKLCLNKQEQAEMLCIRRAMANSIQCTDCKIEVDGNTLYITVL